MGVSSYPLVVWILCHVKLEGNCLTVLFVESLLRVSIAITLGLVCYTLGFNNAGLGQQQKLFSVFPDLN